MVVYPQVQEALMLTIRMSDNELANAINTPSSHIHYGQKFSAWNITVPPATRQDFAAHRERF
jgi:magnesium-dependent phosphatase 1